MLQRLPRVGLRLTGSLVFSLLSGLVLNHRPSSGIPRVGHCGHHHLRFVLTLIRSWQHLFGAQSRRLDVNTELYAEGADTLVGLKSLLFVDGDVNEKSNITSKIIKNIPVGKQKPDTIGMTNSVRVCKFNMIVKTPPVLSYKLSETFGNIEACVVLSSYNRLTSMINKKVYHSICLGMPTPLKP